MRVFTCTPVDFGGNANFFTRDSGLLCRGLQENGVESRAVMPGAPRPDDLTDLIRTDYANLESAAWWRSHQLDGVVLYAWGSPRFRNVAKAIHDAGCYLILNQDNSGPISPLAGLAPWARDQWALAGSGTTLKEKITGAVSILKGMTVGLAVTDPLRAAHLRQGDRIACVSPAAAAHYRKLCKWYGGDELVQKIRVLPHSVEAEFHDRGGDRKPSIVAVGRWDDEAQKRPGLLATTLSEVLLENHAVVATIAGRTTKQLIAWHRNLPHEVVARVRLAGPLSRAELVDLFARTQIFYSSSAFESFGIAAAEALCSGCSVVAENSGSMESFRWFVSAQSGNLANSPADHSRALLAELAAWQQCDRSAARISATWREQFHAKNVANRVIEMINSR
ncbi:MAG: glycosyltransferase family 4 protein [Verrucomicrobiota bacterium]